MIQLIDIKSNIYHDITTFNVVSKFGITQLTYFDIELSLDNDSIINYMSEWYLNNNDLENRQRLPRKKNLFILDGESVTQLLGCFISSLDFDDNDIAIKCLIVADMIIICELKECSELKSYYRDMKINNILDES